MKYRIDDDTHLYSHLDWNTDLEPNTAEALAFLLPLSADYPGLETWFRSKVVPGLKDGTRRLLRIERDDQLAGLGIAKLEPEERKICTVRIAQSYVGRGIGLRIFDDLLKWLDTDRPHLTVNDRNLVAFTRIFDYYGFNLTSIRNGMYVPNRSELSYNEAYVLQRSHLLNMSANDAEVFERAIESKRQGQIHL
jgi:hypothetical protein